MAIITISRQVAALGDEIAAQLAKELGYTFITREQIRDRIVELGFPKSKLEKYDERKPGFFASLAKGHDDYLNYLLFAVLEAASKWNCILIGRSTFAIFENVPGLIALRLVAKEDVRRERLQKEFNWTEKQAQARIDESDNNRAGFHKNFFNVDNEDATHYVLTLNTGILTQEQAVKQILLCVKSLSTPEKDAQGKKRIGYMLKAQEMINKLVFEYKLNINFLRGQTNEDGSVITLQGVADSQAIVDRAITLASKILPSCTIKSAISIVQDFRSTIPVKKG